MSKAIKFNVTADGATITAMINAWAKAAKTVVDRLNVILASVVLHAIKHGNVTPARAALVAMGTGKTAWRSNAALAWLEAKGPFVYNKETKQLDYDKPRIEAFKAEVAKDEGAFVKALLAEPFYAFKPQSEYEGFVLKAEMAKLLKKAHRASDKHKDSGKVDLTGIEVIEDAFKAAFNAVAA